MTAGLVWQGVLVLALTWRETRSLRWGRVRDALWLRPPSSPRSGRVGGRLWWVLVPAIAIFGLTQLLPSVKAPSGRDLGVFLESADGQHFLAGNWAWLAIIVVLAVFNTVLGEELLFRGLLLPRMRGAFGKKDWLANGRALRALSPGHAVGDTRHAPQHFRPVLPRSAVSKRLARNHCAQRPVRHHPGGDNRGGVEVAPLRRIDDFRHSLPG
jgi:hypothetical protein